MLYSSLPNAYLEESNSNITDSDREDPFQLVRPSVCAYVIIICFVLFTFYVTFNSLSVTSR